jgi:hypothetical protein
MSWSAATGTVGGSGAASRIAFWNGATSLTSNINLYWDNTNNRLGIGTSSPNNSISTTGSIELVNSSTQKIIGTGDNLTLEQTGDAIGTTRLKLLNRVANAGLLIEQAGSEDVVDIVYKGLSLQRNIRLENRNTNDFIAIPEYQLGTAGDPTLVISDNASAFRKGTLAVGKTIISSGLTFDVAGNAGLTNTSNTAAELRLFEPNGSGTNYTAFKAQAQSANLTYTLPPSAPAADGYVLSSTTAGVMSWESVGSGDVTGPASATDNAIARYHTGTGKIIQNSAIAIEDYDASIQGNVKIKVLASVATNISLVLSPKGNGALMATQPDNLAAGGNARGLYAVDWQLDRTAATQVASGDYATISGGQNNTASNVHSTVAGGSGNIASGESSFVGGGENNLASGDNSVVSGGLGNDAQSIFSTITGGNSNSISASSNASVISGGSSNTILNGNYSSIAGGRMLTLDGARMFGYHANVSDGSKNMTIVGSNTAVFGNVDLWLASNDNTPRAIRFYDQFNTAGTFPGSANFVGLKAPNNVTADLTYTLPASAPAADGYVLSSTTAGVMSWEPPTSGSTVSTNSTMLGDGSGGNLLRINLGNSNTWTANQTFGGTFLITSNSRIAMTNSDNNARDIRFQEPSGTGSQYVGFRSPSVSNNGNYQWPAAVGSVGQVMKISYSNGIDSAFLTWGSYIASGEAAGGDLSGTYPNPTIAANAITSSKIADGAITNADINASAAIVYSKLDLSNSIVGSDIASGTFSTSDVHFALGNTGTASELRLLEPSGSGANYTAFKAQAQSANLTYTLPVAAPAGDGYVLSSTTAGVMSWTAQTAGLTNFTESVNTSSPNGTVPVVRFLATNASATNVDVALTPKGSGALTAQSATSTIAGGSKRGSYAVDWQLDRTAPNQVASGDYSTVSGGQNNRASGQISTVGGGNGNAATGASSTISGGKSNDAIGTYSTVGGGFGNTASGGFEGFATVAGGSSNSATGDYSFIGGGVSNSVTGDTSFIGGGFSNSITKANSTISGGYNNTITNDQSTIGGGLGNDVAALSATISGGNNNTIEVNGHRSSITGGGGNTITGAYSTIAGGRQLTLNGDNSFGFHANVADGTKSMTIAASKTAVFGNVDIWLASNDNAPSAIRFYDQFNTAGPFPGSAKYVALKAPNNVTADQVYTLPADAPTSAGRPLTSSTSGVMSWGRRTIQLLTQNVDCGNLAAFGGTAYVDVAVTGAVVGSTVTVSPRGDMEVGVIIASARVSAADNVRIKFVNATGGAIDPDAVNFDITVVQP